MRFLATLGGTRDKIGINKQIKKINMQKKEYLVPALEVVEMEYVSVLANSPSFDLKEEEDENDPNKQNTNKHNGFNHTWE